MFYYIEGEVSLIDGSQVVIDCCGVGYSCTSSLNTISNLKIGERFRLYTYMHIYENGMDLYGFSSLNELNCFKMIISISGVGPKAAISILSKTTPEQFAVAIINGNSNIFNSVKGIGKKTAEKIIFDLKDKIKKLQIDEAALSNTVINSEPDINPAVDEAISALVVLGYSKKDIVAVMKGMDFSNMIIEDIVKDVLRKIGQK